MEFIYKTQLKNYHRTTINNFNIINITLIKNKLLPTKLISKKKWK